MYLHINIHIYNLEGITESRIVSSQCLKLPFEITCCAWRYPGLTARLSLVCQAVALALSCSQGQLQGVCGTWGGIVWVQNLLFLVKIRALPWLSCSNCSRNSLKPAECGFSRVLFHLASLSVTSVPLGPFENTEKTLTLSFSLLFGCFFFFFS